MKAFVIFLLILTACAEPDIRISDVNLRTHYFKFMEEAAARQKEILIDYELTIVLQDVKWPRTAECLTNGRKKVIAVEPHWYYGAYADQVEMLIFHECGHCILGRGHNNTMDDEGNKVSIMNEGGVSREYYQANREALLDELFFPDVQ